MSILPFSPWSKSRHGGASLMERLDTLRTSRSSSCRCLMFMTRLRKEHSFPTAQIIFPAGISNTNLYKGRDSDLQVSTSALIFSISCPDKIPKCPSQCSLFFCLFLAHPPGVFYHAVNVMACLYKLDIDIETKLGGKNHNKVRAKTVHSILCIKEVL